jgi:hypothetical protein
LFVFLHGLGGSAQGAKEIVKCAARLGFHAVGITYVNEVVPFTLCGTTSSDCYENLRLETLDGIDHSPYVAITPANSVFNRITKLLQYLDAQHPGEGWAEFVRAGAPDWSSIVVWGHSQGGANAAVLAKHVALRGLMMSAPATDYVNGQPAAWWTGHATLTERMYGFCHVQDQLSAKIAAWDDQGLDDFGAVQDVATSPLPYAGTHQLSTSVAPAISGQYHNSVVIDNVTPREIDGTPVYEPAWRAMMLGALAEGSAHLSVCLGDGSEGPCPCANSGSAGRGCANSANAQGGLLSASGVARVSFDTLAFNAEGLSGQVCLFYQGSVLAAPVASDDGLSCVSSAVVRLGTKPVNGGASSYPQPGDASISVRGFVPAAGGTRFYQAFYRNAATFCTSATSNRTSGLAVAWLP